MNVTIGSLELYFHSFYVPRTWRIGTFVGAESRVFFGGVSDQVGSTYITAASSGSSSCGIRKEPAGAGRGERQPVVCWRKT